MNVAPCFSTASSLRGAPIASSAPQRRNRRCGSLSRRTEIHCRSLWSAAACRRFSYSWNCSRWEFSALTRVERRTKSGSKLPHSKSRPGRSRSTINFGCVDILLRSAPVQTCHPESPRPSQKIRRGVRDLLFGFCSVPVADVNRAIGFLKRFCVAGGISRPQKEKAPNDRGTPLYKINSTRIVMDLSRQNIANSLHEAACG